MRLRQELLLFAVGGILGLIVDAGVVQALVSGLGWNPYGARIVSFALAATITWWWNRRRTFAHRPSGRSAIAEWSHWMVLMGFGAAVNYGVFALLLWLVPALHPWPAIPTAAGSAVAAAVNFLTARSALFRRSETSI
ncbi:MAG TPA: GtrA family protein [Dyella sp.]|uniref:GtrA family protein n=1 Tax=Dyella sp. TaxID=1869338 RepID=UPI002F93700E